MGKKNILQSTITQNGEENKGFGKNNLGVGKDLISNLSYDRKNLILEIIGKEEINDDDLKALLGVLTKVELEKIRENKDLIVEVLGKEISVLDIHWYGKKLSKITKVELEKIRENKDLIVKITGEEEINVRNIENLKELSREDLENIIENRDLIVEITGEVISIFHLSHYGKELSKITKVELEKIRENKDLILKIVKEKNINASSLECLRELTREELEKIRENKDLIEKFLGREILVYDLYLSGKEFSESGEYLKQLDNESIDYCNSKNIKELWMIVMVDKIMKNSGKIRDYVGRKQEYLENNRLIDDSKFEELFEGKGKYGKGEINQKRLCYCFLYTAYEILKKMNYFDVLIKTNLKESEKGDGWYVRLPMGQADGQWINVSKKEIDKKFDVYNEKRGLREGVSINSDSPLGFKILEIAYIKKKLMDCAEDIKQEYLDTGNVSLNGRRIGDLEGGSTIFTLRTIIGDDNVMNRNNRKIEDEKNIDIVFDNFKRGLIVELTVKDDVEERQDILIKHHSYSLERCYIDKDTGEKRVCIVNPWYTGKKYVDSLERAKRLFDWRVTYIDVDKLFR